MSGIAGIITLSVTIIDTCVQYYYGVANAQEQMTRLVQEVINLKKVLSSVQDNIVFNPQVAKAFGTTSSVTLEQFASSSPGKDDAEGHVLLLECENTLKTILDKLATGASNRSTSRKLRVMVWPFAEKDVNKDVDRLHRCANIFQAMIATDTLAIGVETHLQLRAARKEQQDWHCNEETLNIVQWLSALDFNAKHSSITSLRHPGTDMWFVEGAEFTAWHSTSPAVYSTLWLVGHPGVGKTVLSSLVIDHLSTRTSPTKATVAYIYCDYDDQEAQSAPAIIGSICSQLVEQAPGMPDCVITAYRKARNGRLQLSLEEYIMLLIKIINLLPDVFVVLDASDELEEKRNTRIHVIEALARLKGTSARVFITSRPHFDLGATIVSCKKLEIHANKDDIKRFVVDKLENDEDLVDLLQDYDELKGQLVDIILKQADDQFLLPTLHLNRLRDCTCAEEVQETSGDMGGTLDDAYEKALGRVNEQAKPKRALAFVIFSLLSGARRPLQLEEMQEAIAVQPDRMGISKASFRTAKLMLQVCVGLIMIDPASHVIRFVHLTFQDYIDRRALRILPEDVNSNMAQRCLSYLQFDAFKDGPCIDDQTFEERLRSNRFYHYAATHWGHHAKGDIERVLLGKATQLVKRNLQHLSASIQARYIPPHASPGYSQSYPRGVGGLWIAAEFGLTLLAQRLLQEGEEVDAKTSLGSTPLHEAAKQGHVSIITLLLNHGAQVNLPRGTPKRLTYRLSDGAESRTHHYDTSNYTTLSPRLDTLQADGDFTVQDRLVAAARDRDLGEVTQLISAGACGHVVDNRGRTALHWAVRNNDEELTTLLLENDADVNFIDKFDKAMRTALLEAARSTSKNTDLMRSLLEHGANPNFQATQWGLHRSPLHEAALLGDYEKTSLLLEFGANENLLDRNGQAAIDIAVSQRHLGLVELLATASSQRGHGETALHLAAAAGHADASQVLIRSLANLESLTSIAETPLHWAVSKGQVLVTRLLLDAGADANATTSSGETALHIAAAKGEVAPIKLLLAAAANINALSKAGHTPLYAASFSGIETAVTFLLSSKADVDACGQFGATPLIGAAGQGHTATVTALLAHGADAFIRHGYDGKTALHRSAQAGHVAVSEILLSHGADIEARDDDLNTPLRLASSDGCSRSPVLECLLRHGATVDAVDVWGETPLQRASFKGHLDNVRTLLKHGASPASEDPTRWCEGHGSGWKFLEQVATARDCGGGKYKTMDIRGWPAAVQAALMGQRDIVKVLLAHDCEAKDRWNDPELLLSLAEYRGEVNRLRGLEGKRMAVEGGWTDIELKVGEDWDVISATWDGKASGHTE